METKFKVNDKVYFLWGGNIFEGEINGIEILIRKGYETKISYIVRFIDEDEIFKHMNESLIFKTKLECALSLLCDSADKINVEKKNGEYIFKIKEEELHENE